MLAYAHCLISPQANPSASVCLSIPTPLLSIAAYLVLRQVLESTKSIKNMY